MYKRMVGLLSFVLLLFLMSSCQKPLSKSEETWERIFKSGENTRVNIAYDLDVEIDDWIMGSFAGELSTSLGIKLKTQEFPIERLIRDLESSLEDSEPEGDIDIVIVTAEQFKTLKDKGLLYGPFADKLPNYNKYMSNKDYSNTHVDLFEIDSSAVCFLQKQLCFFYNDDLLFDPPQDLETLKIYVKANPGTFAYPHPSTPEGRAFVESVILEFTNNMEFMEEDISEKELRELILPGLEYLKEIKPYLKAGGRFNPTRIEDYDAMFSSGELNITMSMDHLHADKMVSDLLYPDNTRAIDLIQSSVSERIYAIIPYNSKNKSGAMMVLNKLLEPRVQLSLYKCEDFSGTVVYSPDSMYPKLKSKLDSKLRKKTVSKPSRLVRVRKSPIPEGYWQYILKEWRKL